jgi:hypothetical protein
MTHPDLGGMTMDVAVETLLASIGNPDGTTGAKSEEARVHLEADVLPSSERPTHATEDKANFFFWKCEAFRNLLAVLMEPLGGDVQLDSGVAWVWNCEGCFEAEECLILHADLVRAFDLNFTDDVCVSTDDPLVTEDVSIGVDLRS